MTRIYRILVQSSDGEGSPYSFTYHLPKRFTSSHRGMCKILLESITPIKASPTDNNYDAQRSVNRGGILVNLESIAQNHSHNTFDGRHCRSIAFLQSWCDTGLFGRNQGVNYCRKSAIGPVFDSSVLHNLTHLKIDLQHFSGVNGSVNNLDSNWSIENWSMTLLFHSFQEDIERPLREPYCKIVVSSANRHIGTVADFRVNTDLNFPHHHADKKWGLAVEWASTVFHDSANLPDGLALRCSLAKHGDSEHDEAVYVFNRSYWPVEDKYLGIVLRTNTWLGYDHISHPMSVDPRKIREVRFELVDAVTGNPPSDIGSLSEYLVCLVMWPYDD